MPMQLGHGCSQHHVCGDGGPPRTPDCPTCCEVSNEHCQDCGTPLRSCPRLSAAFSIAHPALQARCRPLRDAWGRAITPRRPLQVIRCDR